MLVCQRGLLETQYYFIFHTLTALSHGNDLNLVLLKANGSSDFTRARVGDFVGATDRVHLAVASHVTYALC